MPFFFFFSPPLCCAFVQPCGLSYKFALLLDKFPRCHRRRSCGIGCRIWKGFWLALTAGADPDPGGSCCIPGAPRPSSRGRTVCPTLWRISWPFKVPASTSPTKSQPPQLCHTRCPRWPCKTLGNRRWNAKWVVRTQKSY